MVLDAQEYKHSRKSETIVSHRTAPAWVWHGTSSGIDHEIPAELGVLYPRAPACAAHRRHNQPLPRPRPGTGRGPGPIPGSSVRSEATAQRRGFGAGSGWHQGPRHSPVVDSSSPETQERLSVALGRVRWSDHVPLSERRARVSRASGNRLSTNRAPVAQWIERLTSDQKAGGSNPSGRATATAAVEARGHSSGADLSGPDGFALGRPPVRPMIGPSGALLTPAAAAPSANPCRRPRGSPSAAASGTGRAAACSGRRRACRVEPPASRSPSRCAPCRP